MNIIRVLALSLLFCLSFYTSSFAEKVSSFKVNGSNRIPESTIISYTNINIGDDIERSDISKAVRSLYASGFFEDVVMDIKNQILVITVKENSLINTIAFEGNDKINDEDLQKELTMKERGVFSLSRLQSDINRLISLYKRSGMFSVNITPKKIQLDENRMNLVYVISEGSKAKIQEINFIGNENFSDYTLSGVILSRTDAWYRFLSSSDFYDQDRLIYDQQLLHDHYTQRGYADFRNISATGELTTDGKAFIVTFLLEEGEVYKFGKLEILNYINTKFNDDLLKLSQVEEGDIYDSKKISKTIEAMNDYLGEHGYAFVDIDFDVEKDKNQNIANIVIKIQSSPKVYINKIHIKNNVRTLDEVVRRELEVAEGDPYNTNKIIRSRQNVSDLDYFKKVEFTNKRTDNPDQMDLEVEVEEKSTGTINLGVGYSTLDGALAQVGISEKNFLGKGQVVNASVLRSKKQLDTRFGFMEPYFLGKNLSAGFSVFYTKTDSGDESSYRSKAHGFSLFTGYKLTENLTHRVFYSLQRKHLQSTPKLIEDMAVQVRESLGRKTSSAIGHSFDYNRLDSRINPTEGYVLNLTQTLAGVGGNTKYIRHEFDANHFTPFFDKKVILHLGFSAGHVMGHSGKRVYLDDRFTLGGFSLRGFDFSGVGPRSSKTYDSLGGTKYFTQSTDITFPIGLPNEFGIKGFVFNDFGMLDGVEDKNKEDIVHKNSLRASYGVGINFDSIMGNFVLTLGWPYKKEKFDKRQTFLLNVKKSF